MKLMLIILSLFVFYTFPQVSHAQANKFYKARVENILETEAKSQKLKIKFLDGTVKDSQIIVNHSLETSKPAKAGDTLILVETLTAENSLQYQIFDFYRLDKLVLVLSLFFILVVVLSRWRGVGSILGMLLSLLIIIKYIVPQIIAGANPLMVSIIGCFMIMTSSIYFAHGFSAKTTLAVISTLITLTAVGLISVFAVGITNLTGLGSEDAFSLLFGPTSGIDFRGLLLGGILIGALGVLDDVTTSLTASIFEIHKVAKTQSFPKLFTAGLEIGREHITSLVNTLVLAYAGAALPVFLMIIVNVNNYPLWLVFNDSLLAEEIVRTVSGSIGLILSVPLTTFLASYYVARLNKS